MSVFSLSLSAFASIASLYPSVSHSVSVSQYLRVKWNKNATKISMQFTWLQLLHRIPDCGLNSRPCLSFRGRPMCCNWDRWPDSHGSHCTCGRAGGGWGGDADRSWDPISDHGLVWDRCLRLALVLLLVDDDRVAVSACYLGWCPDLSHRDNCGLRSWRTASSHNCELIHLIYIYFPFLLRIILSAKQLIAFSFFMTIVIIIISLTK